MIPEAAIWHPSPNFGPRRGGATPDLIVLHYTAMDNAQAALDRLCAPEFEVSAHFLIGRDGRLWQLVAEDQRAWHAGAGSWGQVTDVNSRSFGIELDNDGRVPFSAPQMDCLEFLLARLAADWAIPPQRIIGHSDMAPERKTDPGPRFDWRRLARQGLAVWPGASEIGTRPSADSFAEAASKFGYPETAPDNLLSTVRARFRPWKRGPIDGADLALIVDLARRYPVDGTGPSA